jgi:hypothetical protein
MLHYIAFFHKCLMKYIRGKIQEELRIKHAYDFILENLEFENVPRVKGKTWSENGLTRRGY